jgi:hypothetical protein
VEELAAAEGITFVCGEGKQRYYTASMIKTKWKNETKRYQAAANGSHLTGRGAQCSVD